MCYQLPTTTLQKCGFTKLKEQTDTTEIHSCRWMEGLSTVVHTSHGNSTKVIQVGIIYITTKIKLNKTIKKSNYMILKSFSTFPLIIWLNAEKVLIMCYKSFYTSSSNRYPNVTTLVTEL